MCVESDHSHSVIGAYLKALKRRRYSPKTIATYRYPLSLFASFLAARAVARLQDVGRDDLAAWRLDIIRVDLPQRRMPVTIFTKSLS